VTRDELLQSLRAVLARPASARELQQRLLVPREERVTFSRHLRALAAEGAVIQLRGHRYALPGGADHVVGVLQMHPDGYGFVTPDHDPASGDLYIPRSQLHEALHGDRVAVRQLSPHGDRRREGRVVRVVERGISRMVGQVAIDAAGRVHVVPFDRRLRERVIVPPGESRDAAPGDMVEIEITRWPTATRGPVGRVIDVLGQPDAPGVDTTVILRRHGIAEAHSAGAVAEAGWMGTEVRPRDCAGRTDFRSSLTVTIDGEDARDFDDAVSVVRREGGGYRLGVHIADVAHYVKTGSALDDDARDRGTSVYFPDRAIHMFPAELATGQCSLNPGVDRLVQSCVIEIEAGGEPAGVAFHDGVICSRARLTYAGVNAVLTGRPLLPGTIDPDVVTMLRDMHSLFELLRDRRRRRGSIDFDLPEAEIRLDEEGQVEAITASERNDAHRLIEEFMLLANEAVASELERREVPAIYRIHEAPDPAKVEMFDAFLATLGHSLGAPAGAVRPRHFQQLVGRVAGTAVARPVAFLMLRTMSQARYDTVNTGHFGLAMPAYTHFTSPIRRYPDLVVHRLLRASRRGEVSGPRRDTLEDELPAVAEHASERERRAADAERELVQWKKVRFMADRIGEEFDGYVTGVSAYGLFVELTDPFVEGLVHLSTLADDEYRYLESARAIHGVRSRRVYRLGDRVRVRVLRVDTDRRLIDLGLASQIDAIVDGTARRPRTRSRTTRPASDRRRHTPRQPPRSRTRRRR
jgi:ribonuclease R